MLFLLQLCSNEPICMFAIMMYPRVLTHALMRYLKYIVPSTTYVCIHSLHSDTHTDTMFCCFRL